MHTVTKVQTLKFWDAGNDVRNVAPVLAAISSTY